VKNNKSESILNARSFLEKITLLSVISGDEDIAGITVLNSELFIVQGKSSLVHVYNTINFTWTRNIFITGSRCLRAIAASPRYNCLYISDAKLNVVYRYNLSNNVSSNWSVGGECYGISLTSAENVIVSQRDTKQIQEYTPDGSLVRKISLISSIGKLYHSVELSSNRFVLSGRSTDESLHRVCIVDTDERIIQCYGGLIGSGVGQLNRPSHLAVDRHGNVLVADRGNNRVVMLSPSLTHLGYIEVPGHRLHYPFALHLHEPTHRLYIGERTDNARVSVYSLPDQR